MTEGGAGLHSLPSLAHTKLHFGHSFVWTHLFPESSQVPKARCKHASCLHNGAIYTYGGICGNVSLKDLWRFEPGVGLWTKLECGGDAPPFLQEHTMIGYKDALYIFGGLCGFDYPGETSLWTLDLQTYTWSKQVIHSEVKTPSSRRGHSVVQYGGAMHLFGGHVDLKGSCNELWTLDFETLYWHTTVYKNQDSAPPPRHSHTAVIHGSCMYVYGGNNNLQPMRDMWKWNFECRQWSKVRFWQGPPALRGHSAHSLGDSMLIYGGEDASGSYRNELWVFSYSSESWTKVAYKGSIMPSPTIHQTLVLDIPDSALLYPPHDERSLSAPFLQRPSVSSLDVVSGRRPYSSPAYTADARSGSRRGRRDRAFKNRIHPGGRQAPLPHDGPHQMDMSSDDGEEDDDHGDVGDVEEEEEEEDAYKSRIFIPVWEHMNSSRDLLCSEEVTSEMDASPKFLKTARVKPEVTGDRTRVDPCIDGAPLITFDITDQRVEKRIEPLPQVRIEDYDSAVDPSMFHRSWDQLNDATKVNLECNNNTKLKERPRLIQVLPKSKSDEIPLLPIGRSVDDLNMNNVSHSQKSFAFVNNGFTLTDDCLNAHSRPRSNSLTSINGTITTADHRERYHSVHDLPSVAKLILQRREQKMTKHRHYQSEIARPSGNRPKLKKRSQTDHALYAKTIQYSNGGMSIESQEAPSGKGCHHLPVPVHLYVLGGMEPNVSSLHKYQTPLPVFRCTIVPGKPSPSEIQALLH